MIVKNRQQMAQLLNERMTRTYITLSERHALEPDTSLVKTYLVEAHLPESTEPTEALEFAEETFSEQSFGGASRLRDLRSHRTDETTLLSVEVKFRDEQLIIYVDFTNPRYWLLHSMGSSKALDWFIGRLVKARPELDRAWLSIDLLEHVSTMGSFRGLSLDYDRRVIPDVDFESPQAPPVEFLKMQLWANKAERILQILRNEYAFPHETTLSKIRVKFRLNGESDGDFSLDDIKYDGKVTARGTSFQSHITLVSNIYYEEYANQIRELEDKYALRSYQSNGRLILDGEPINFLFERPIANIEVFCKSVFSCGEPFRLWGVPVRMAKDFYRVQAVDLHVGSSIQFEIAPELMRVYLPAGSCGNSIVRLYTNLQHRYDALVRVEDGDGRRIFEFQPDHA